MELLNQEMKEKVRRLVLARKHDLVKEPLKYVYVIFCRSVSIYFDKAMQHWVLSKFHFTPLSFSYLILGPI